MDYCFMGSETSVDKVLTILVARDRDSRMTCSTVVPRKGTTGSFAAKRINAFINEMGCEFVDVTIKSDQEPAIVALVDDIKKLRPEVRTHTELSPVGSSQSNGVVERGIQSVQGQVRTMKSALENRWNISFPDEHPVLTWLVEHAAVLLNKCETGHDGKLAHERL